jgi:predicted 2-oxoglutarate/Fe(II)-dependent dioxygenase YbiX
MSTSDLIAKYDLLLRTNFIDESTCRRILDESLTATSGPATVYGQSNSGAVNDRVRKTTRFQPSSQTKELITGRLLEYKPAIERHFQISLHDCEEPQFLRYDVGDFFVAHQDGNTGLIRLASDADRKISITLFLNQQTNQPLPRTFSGGSLKFSDYRAEPAHREFVLTAEPGLLVAFRSETTHEVTPVTTGARYSIVTWYR